MKKTIISISQREQILKVLNDNDVDEFKLLMKLSDCVSQVTITKDATKEPAFTILRECKGARVVQK